VCQEGIGQGLSQSIVYCKTILILKFKYFGCLWAAKSSFSETLKIQKKKENQESTKLSSFDKFTFWSTFLRQTTASLVYITSLF